jgi:uncharacterized SAM-binding protein YcdF (DUF218 family)
MKEMGRSRENRENRENKGKLRRAMSIVALIALVAMIVASLLWCQWVSRQIDSYATLDQAAPSDAIVVFGAAEYDGKPSPVLRARLEHALALYNKGIAPLLITLGGGEEGDNFSEGSVGRAYLRGAGVPDNAIIAETKSRNTLDSARQVAVIARANGLRRLVIVSDGTHLFRIHAICASEGLKVLTSPRPRVEVEGGVSERQRVLREILSYTLWRLLLR